jgi:putative nucleotidyltransferase with HDIG domain
VRGAEGVVVQLFDDLVPKPNVSRIDWRTIEDAFDWFRLLEGCPQDPIFHAEGDVKVHTRLVAEALVDAKEWRGLPVSDRSSLFWAALLHDVGKPATTRIDQEGRVTAQGHSRRGQIMARQVLWRMRAPYVQREQICHLVTHHQRPLYLLERENPERLLHLISHQTRCDLLAILAEADVRGRTCPDSGRLMDAIEMFRELARIQDCLVRPRDFYSAHSRFLYFRTPGRSADYAAHDDWTGHATLLCGLPASGKDTWLAANARGHAIIALDAVRELLGIDAGDPQGAVVSAARELAREALRAGRPLIWNATNLSRERRRGLIDLFADYRAKVRIVYCETDEPETLNRNGKRQRSVPTKALIRMLDHWEPPDLTECHDLEVVLS